MKTQRRAWLDVRVSTWYSMIVLALLIQAMTVTTGQS